MFNAKSRYINSEQYLVTDRRGRKIMVVSIPFAPDQSILGFHQLKQGQRIDHLASKYTLDDAGSWRIAEANDVMLAESLSEQPEIAIPNK